VVGDLDQAEKVACVVPKAELSPGCLQQGFRWLGHWELIVPFRPYNELLLDKVKGKKDEKIVQLGDLRVPVFDTRLVFLLVNEETKKFWDFYRSLVAENYDAAVAFYIALWEYKPYYKPLPAGVWLHV